MLSQTQHRLNTTSQSRPHSSRHYNRSNTQHGRYSANDENEWFSDEYADINNIDDNTFQVT